MSGRTESVATRLAADIEQGNHYEALQRIQSLVPRYLSTGKTERAETLVREASTAMSKVGEWTSAADVAKLYVTAMREKGVAWTDGTRGVVLHLLDALDACERPELLRDFVDGAVSWAGDDASGVHERFGAYLARRGHLALACRHLVLGNDAKQLADALFAWSKHGSDGEAGLFLARAVLQLYALGKAATGRAVVAAFAELATVAHADDTGYGVPMFNFLDLLGQAVEAKMPAAVFTGLRERYAPSLRRDEDLGKLVTAVGAKHFGVVPERAGGGIMSMVQDIMGELLNPAAA